MRLPIPALAAILVLAAACTASGRPPATAAFGDSSSLPKWSPRGDLPIDKYVAAPDDTYAWNVSTEVMKGFGSTSYNVFLTSQTWLNATESSQPVWYHWLQICIPDDPVDTDIAFLYIDGGRTPQFANPPSSQDALIDIICLGTRAVSAHLTAVPNEPIVFQSDWKHESRTEDEVIAFTWSKVINQTLAGDVNPNWMLRFPMTKSAVRALDTIAAFVNQTQPQIQVPTKFIVGGASKRGWTTWTTAAVDSRVVAQIPIVAPVGELVKSSNIMWQSYNGWSFALDPYLGEPIMSYLNKPVFQEMLDYVSPMTFLDRYTMPTFIICDTGDEFFMDTDVSLFWGNLTYGEKYVRFVPDAEHSLSGHQIDVALDVTTFAYTIIHDTARPQFSWVTSADGETITVTVAESNAVPVKKALLWRAYNSKHRDFRLVTCAEVKTDPNCLNPIFWLPHEIHPEADGTYVAHVEAPATGWSGFFVELEFEDGAVSAIDPLKMSTTVSIVPLTFEYPPCPPDTCG